MASVRNSGDSKNVVIRTFAELAQVVDELDASDIYLTPGQPVHLLVRKQLTPVGPELSKRFFDDIMSEAYGGTGLYSILGRREEVDFSATFKGEKVIRFRVNVALADGTPFAVFRRLKDIEHRPEDLGIPQSFTQLFDYPYGLILVIGPTGSGKSTTLATSLAEHLTRKKKVVVTIEDPIEYMIPKGIGLVFQREVGRDTISFAQGVRAAMRERPNIILVGEVRDTDTTLAALAAAETGHLVLGTLHAKDVSVVAERLAGMFPPAEAQAVRMRVAETLVGVFAQQLVKGKDGKLNLTYELIDVGRAPYTVRQAYERGKRPVIRNYLEQSRTRLVDSVLELIKAGRITPKAGFSVANDISEFQAEFEKHGYIRRSSG